MIASDPATPRFSILLPTHNRADVLPFAIRSILAQSVPDFELLIVGDGCTDNTAEVVRSFSDARIRWFDLPKAPHFGYANRNIALRQARGTQIAYMAHDDLWLHDHLEKIAPLLEEPGMELAYSRPLWIIPGGLIAPGTFNLQSPATLKLFQAKEKNRIPSPCVVHRRSCFDHYGYWNETLAHRGDWDLWARIIAGGAGRNFAYLAEPTCLHFRAEWRTSPALVGENEKVWEMFHALEGFMPDALKIPVPREITEQEAVWQAMSDEPCKWTTRLRAAIGQALDQRLSESDELIEALAMRHPALQAATIHEHFKDLTIAWKPGYLLRKLIGLNNRIRRFSE